MFLERLWLSLLVVMKNARKEDILKIKKHLARITRFRLINKP